ncbi:MAG: lactonase family protein [Lentimicrobium sp.]|nr:lactonase family protein [Lentimicrobium sp.]
MKNRHFLKLLKLFTIILLVTACSAPDSGYLVYVGTYTGHGSDGIYAYRFNPASGDLSPIGLVAKTDNPSFIAIDFAGRYLYAVNELDSFQNQPTGAISVFEINRKSGKLTFLQQISSLGAAPAHLSLDKSGRYLLVANYNGGNVAVFPIGSNGLLGPHTSLIQNSGSGINPDRQAGPHAHFIQPTNDNKFVMIADLGVDKVFINRLDTLSGKLTPADSGYVKLDPASGPRHIAFSPSGKFVYVLNELSSTITMFIFDSETGAMQTKQTLTTLPENFSGKNSTAEIVVDRKGKFLYVSNRGDNSIALFSINSGDGSLTPVEWFSSGGKTPRNFEIDPTGQWLFAANQDSDNIALFRIDTSSGRLTQISDSTKVSSPVCIRFLETTLR